MGENGEQIYLFGPFRLEPCERRLLRDGQAVALTPKAFDTLVLLIERAGHLVEKEELMRALWPDSYVEEANISQYVWTLRKTLGEVENGNVFIETVPKKGFRFVAPVTVHHEPASPALVEDETSIGPAVNALDLAAEAGAFPVDLRETFYRNWLSRRSLRLGTIVVVVVIGALGLWLTISKKRAETSPGQPVKTLAVLPFKPLSADSRDESLEMGMAETLITRLSNVRQIVVRPMSVARKYTDLQQDPIKAGQELQTEAVLDGSIQKAGDRIRVTVRLMNVQSGATLWAEQFDENFTDIFKVQDSISERLVNALTLKLSSGEQTQLSKHYTDNAEAYQLFLQGDYLREKMDFTKALEFYQRAIERDPAFSLAYIGLADSSLHTIHGGVPRMPVEEALPKARAALTRALELEETLAEAHNILAAIKYQFEFDWSGAEREFRRAIELNPNVAYIHIGYGWYLMMAGRLEEAKPEIERAQALEPHSLTPTLSFGVLYYFSRDYDRALDRFQKILEVEPNYPGAFSWIENIYQQKGMYAEALEYAMKDGIRVGRLKPEEAQRRREILKESGWPGILRMRLDINKKTAMHEPVSTRNFAGIYARLGDKDQAFAWLNKGIDEDDPFAIWLKIDPQYDSLRSDPRYTKLLQRMNMTP